MFRKLPPFFLACLIVLSPLAHAQAAAQPVGADLLPRTVFGVLLGEIALDRGKSDIALGAYVDLARRSRDPVVIQRAFEIANGKNMFDLALELARLWGQSDPQSFQAQQAITATLVRLNRLDELAGQIAVMLERDKTRLGEHLIYLNRMLASQPDKAAVDRLVQKVASPYVGIAEAHYAMAVAAFSAGDHERSRQQASKAIDLRPDWELAALVYARALAKTAPVESITFLRRFVSDNPKAADARLTLARLLIAEKNYVEAREHFERILEDYPDTPEVLFPTAMLALQQKDNAAARALLERLLAGSFADKSTVHYYLGEIDEDEKKFDSALGHFQQVISGDQYLTARGRAALMLTRLGRFEEALSLLRLADTKTKDERLRLGLAEASVLREAKRNSEAFEVLEKLLKESPDDTDLLYESALTAERLGKFDIFEKRLKRSLELRPDDAHTLNALGYSLADRNVRLDEAYALIKKAANLKPNDPFIMDSLGWVLFRQGKAEEGLAILQAAYKIRPDAEIAAHVGEVLWVLGRREEALSLWRSAAEKHPDSDVLATTIKKFQP
ncbi:MAG: repeat:Tetratricopeptide 4 [Proteobacteria bacterium]|nr:repeat:Tetratricopeptide 4 [Pseudomonadota bacterium]